MINLGDVNMMNVKKATFGLKHGDNPEFTAEDQEDIEIKPKFKNFIPKLM